MIKKRATPAIPKAQPVSTIDMDLDPDDNLFTIPTTTTTTTAPPPPTTQIIDLNSSDQQQGYYDQIIDDCNEIFYY